MVFVIWLLSQVLSACDTGRGRVAAEGIVGLARGLLAAGAGAAVVSLWAVPDLATRLLMDPFYYALNRGCSAANALRFAMNLMAQHGGRHAAPRYWAGFVIVGTDTCPIPSQTPSAAGSPTVPYWTEWTVEEVEEWLQQCNLGEICAAFKKNKVNGQMLATWASSGEKATKKSLKVLHRSRLRAAGLFKLKV